MHSTQPAAWCGAKGLGLFLSSSGGSDNEAELIERARNGDAEAFCCLARNYERRIYLLALYYCREPSDAEDLSQEVWLKAYKALGTFRGDASFYTWLRRIMVNVFLDHKHDKQKHQQNNSFNIDAEISDTGNEWSRAIIQRTDNFETSAHRHLLVEKIVRALDDLTARQRLIFLLKHREEMAVDEIAAMLNCSAGTVKKSLFRVVVKLRRRFGVEIEDKTCAASSYQAREIY